MPYLYVFLDKIKKNHQNIKKKVHCPGKQVAGCLPEWNQREILDCELEKGRFFGTEKMCNKKKKKTEDFGHFLKYSLH